MDTNFTTGAVRSADANHLDFLSISPIAMIALARTCQEGAEKYGHHNWEQGMDTIDLLNHVHRHLAMWQAGDRTEPHLAHALWGMHAAVHMDTLHPGLADARRRGPGCSVTPAMKAHLDAQAPALAARRKGGAFGLAAGWTMERVAEIATILAGRGKGPLRDGSTPMEAVDESGDRREIYRGVVVDPRPLKERLADEFDAAGVTDRDILKSAEPTGEVTGFHPAFQHLTR